MDAGDLNLAVVAFEASIAAYPHFKALELLGECHMRLRNYTSAIVPLAAATTLNRQSRALSLLAEAFERLGEFSDAREFAQLALLRARENRRARDVLARVGTDVTLRHASESDIPWLQRLIEESARALSLGHYTPLQIESAIRYVMLVGVCTVAAETAGVRRLELMATLPGVPLYRACGFTECDRMTDVLPDGTAIEFVRMERRIEG